MPAGDGCVVASPAIRGVLFERPAVIEGVRLPADVAPSIDCSPGDALEAIPGGGDAYLFSTVLRCFDDQACGRVLARCREAMAAHAKLLALEMVTATGPYAFARGSG